MRAVAGVLAALAALAAERPGPDGDCRSCGGAGLVECRACRGRACPPGREGTGALFCSEVAACEDCGGTRRADCARCEAPGDAAWSEERARNREWLDGRRRVDAEMAKELRHAESPHFVLTFSIRRIDVEGAGGPHEAMHVYLDRLEALFELFVADVSADPEEDFFGKTHVLLWDRPEDQEKASLRYTRQPSRTQSKLMGAEPVVSIHYDKNHLHEEFELHQAVVHQVAHCLLSNVFDGIWPGRADGGWIDAGLAHWYEVTLFGSVRHYCYQEADTMRHFKFGRWEPSVRKAVARGEAVPFLQVTGRPTADLSPEEHMFAWSFVDYVLRAHPGRFGPLARSIKAREPLPAALEEALGLNPFELEAAWRAFVEERYSRK